MTGNSTRIYAALTVAAGFAVTIISLIFPQIAGFHACGTIDIPLVMAFEYARGPEDIAAIFGEEPCRSTLVDAFRQHTWLDILAYIIAFTAFQIFAAMMLKNHGPRLARAIIVFALIAGLCDQFEDQILLGLLDAVAANSGEPVAVSGWLYWFVRIKFALLAVNAMLLGILIGRGALFARILGALAIIGGVIAMAGISSRALVDLLALGIGIGWIAILVAAVVNLRQPRPSPV